MNKTLLLGALVLPAAPVLGSPKQPKSVKTPLVTREDLPPSVRVRLAQVVPEVPSAATAPNTPAPAAPASDAPAGSTPAASTPVAPPEGTSDPKAVPSKGTDPATGAATDPATGEPGETVIKIVTERSDSQIGKADAASEGVVGPKQLERRPILRPGDILETVPGVIISQHSGSGKANQYYLRGFNLDHGTDIAISVDGMPVNLPTHAHGQGYTDLNFLFPELVSELRYRKGAYEADQGDFSSAGSVDISYARHLGPGAGIPATESLEGGAFGHRRLLATGNAGERLLYGLEVLRYNGPWVVGEDFKKLNGILRYSSGTATRGLTATAMGYRSNNNSSDQVPQRALDAGLISRYGEIDPTDGGRTHRYSLSSQLRRDNTTVSAYAVDYALNLFSDFTYFLDNPVRGDQFEQEDRRKIYGFKARQDFPGRLGDREMTNSIGFQARRDDIGNVGLYHTEKRERFETVRADTVKETSLAPYLENRIKWSRRFRTTTGLRYDHYNFNVDSSIAANGGKVSDSILSPKFEAAYRASPALELYASAARGFHSNDARGTTITVDPNDPNVQADRVTPLVRSNFAELGARRVKNGLQSTLALFALNFDSELLFTGDAGTTEASRASKRVGVELTNYWTPKPDLTLDFDFATTRSRFRDKAPEGNLIPGALGGVVAAGIAYEPPKGITGALRFRYFGPRTLIEDGSVHSKSSSLFNGSVGYKLKKGLRVNFEVFNILNAKVNDIDYYYTSRLPGEPADGVNDIHNHPVEPRALRVGVTRQF